MLTREHYDYNGWNTKNDGTGDNWDVYEHSLNNNDDVILYTNWMAKEYGINYDLEGGTIPPEQVYDKSYIVEYANVKLPDPSKTHYSFAGWKIGSSENPTTAQTVTPEQLNTQLDEDLQEVTLTAVWVPVIYTITFDSNGGSVENPINYTVAETKPLPTNLTKEHYTFDGWYEASDYSGNAITTTENLGGDKTLYAKWVPVTYTITYEWNAGTAPSDESSYDTTYTVESENIRLPTPTRNYYTLNGWKVGSTNTTIPKNTSSVTPEQLGSEDVTLTAQWGLTAYTIEYHTEGHGSLGSGYTPTTQTGVYTKGYTINDVSDSSFTLPTLSEPGWTFEGWADSSNSSSSIVATAIRNWLDSWSGTKKLYARWTLTTGSINVQLPNYTAPDVDTETVYIFVESQSGGEVYYNDREDPKIDKIVTNSTSIVLRVIKPGDLTFNIDSILWYIDDGEYINVRSHEFYWFATNRNYTA